MPKTSSGHVLMFQFDVYHVLRKEKFSLLTYYQLKYDDHQRPVARALKSLHRFWDVSTIHVFLYVFLRQKTFFFVIILRLGRLSHLD